MQDINNENLEGSIIKIDEKLVISHLNEIVLETVEINGLLETEADQLCGAESYEWSENLFDTRTVSYEKKLLLKRER